MYFNPRSPDGERRVNWYDDYHDVVFQSTLPGWGATKVFGQHGIYRLISIHAPRMGSDTTTGRRTSLPSYFNPRSPDGERQVAVVGGVAAGGFQSTLPGWGATQQ